MAAGATRDWLKKAKKFSFYALWNLEAFPIHRRWRTARGDDGLGRCWRPFTSEVETLPSEDGGPVKMEEP